MSAKFEIQRWQGTIERTLEGFLRINEILSAVDLDKYKPQIEDPPEDSPYADLLAGLKKIQEEAHVVTFEQAHALYRRQMIVHAVTIIESMIKDFAVQLFLRHPARMTSLVGHSTEGNNTERSVPFKLILQAKSKSSLIAGLAKEAATRVAGKLKETRFKRLEEVGKHELPDDLKDKLIGIIDLRNIIIHAHSEKKVVTQKVVDAYKTTLKKLSGELEDMAKKNSIPTDREEALRAFEELKRQRSQR